MAEATNGSIRLRSACLVCGRIDTLLLNNRCKDGCAPVSNPPTTQPTAAAIRCAKVFVEKWASTSKYINLEELTQLVESATALPELIAACKAAATARAFDDLVRAGEICREALAAAGEDQ